MSKRLTTHERLENLENKLDKVEKMVKQLWKGVVKAIDLLEKPTKAKEKE